MLVEVEAFHPNCTPSPGGDPSLSVANKGNYDGCCSGNAVLSSLPECPGKNSPSLLPLTSHGCLEGAEGV